MDFLKSVFADEPTPPDSPKSRPDSPTSEIHSNTDVGPSTWSFGGLIKSLATKSESVIETYRKDFQELGSGFKEETAVIREVASRAVKDLPASFEVGASVAQESLETVGQAIDDIGATFWNSTAQIISHGKTSILASSSDSNYYDSDENHQRSSNLNLKQYSRFDMRVNAIQCDFNTYCNEPEDKVDYENWRLGVFNMEDTESEINSLISENKVIKEIYDEVVPSKVDNQTFWSRYFYKLHKLKRAEEARSLLVKRAISDEDDLSWDFEDEDEDDNYNNNVGGSSNFENKSKNGLKKLYSGDVDKLDKSEEKAEVKGDHGVSSCDVSVVSSHQSLLQEEEDLGWDAIEEIDGSKEEAFLGSSQNVSRVDLRKKLISAEEDEELSWDIDDEPGIQD
ncbi:uncharacterized protein LOC126670778 [Mercurialis annua]|uniref:uncharacterized protein LOC126670778 n=1 Tax=Mercurialis annua TaxID=3986 RepID=UPI00216100BB|nr:uncharacterized protein LOC126670778 [Mercurialis annua]